MNGRRTLRALPRWLMLASMLLSMSLVTPSAASAAPQVKVTIFPHGHWAELQVTAEKPLKYIFSATTDAKQKHTSCPNWDKVLSVVFGGPTKVWKAPVTNLPHGGAIYWKLEAIDPAEQNVVSCQAGTFTTLIPVVTVTFDAIEMIDDGDDWPSGAGEFFFDFGTNGTLHPHLSVGEVTVDSGSTYHPNRQTTLATFFDGQYITISVRGIEMSCAALDFCPQGLPPFDISPDADFGYDYPYRWDTGHSDKIFILYDDFDPDFDKARPYTVTVYSSFLPMHFKLHGTYRVQYAMEAAILP